METYLCHVDPHSRMTHTAWYGDIGALATLSSLMDLMSKLQIDANLASGSYLICQPVTGVINGVFCTIHDDGAITKGLDALRSNESTSSTPNLTTWPPR